MYALLKESRGKIFRRRDLVIALLDWWYMDCEKLDFDDWLDDQLRYVAKQVNRLRPFDAPPCHVVEALSVCAIGDPIALYCAEHAPGSNFETDTNCYVEDNGDGAIVFSNVWLRSNSPKKIKCFVDKVAERFMELGYSPEVLIDEEDPCEATVMAQLDFPLYVKNLEEGKYLHCDIKK